MCGICGIVNFNTAEAVDRGLVEGMANAIAHRGPDDQGFYFGGPVGLGHRRLSIIDLGGGKQPIYNEDGSCVIVFNGEIYNYADVTCDLIGRGHQFRTRSDTEAILHAYEEYGPDCVKRLRGMFAFAIWDGRHKRVFIARDRLGKKPLYYHRGKDALVFASEIKALLEAPFVPREVDAAALDLYLSLRYVPGPRTIYRNIHKLQPGHWMLLEGERLRVEKYWDVEFRPQPRPLARQIEEFRALLEESVRLRMIAEVPLGVFLSGGIDSSTILAAMSRITGGERVKTFSVGYESTGGTGAEEESNEFEYARLAARAFGADHHEYRVKAVDFRDFLPDLVWHLDEPLADPSCVPLYFISRLARQHITVVLSGEGADEVLAGYSIYSKMLAIERLRRFPGARLLAPALARLVPHEKLQKYLRLAGLPLEARYRGVCRGLLQDHKTAVLRNRLDPRRLDDLYSGYFLGVEGAAALNRLLYVDTKVWLPDDLLMKADKMTMATALELRVPFLDHELVEWAATLPENSKLNGGSGKHLLREAMRGILPEAILTRSKKGFPVPTAPWLSGRLRDFAHDALLAPDSGCRRYMDVQGLRQIVREHQQGLDRHEEIWTLLVFEFWHRLFIDRSISHSKARDQHYAEVTS